MSFYRWPRRERTARTAEEGRAPISSRRSNEDSELSPRRAACTETHIRANVSAHRATAASGHELWFREAQEGDHPRRPCWTQVDQSGSTSTSAPHYSLFYCWSARSRSSIRLSRSPRPSLDPTSLACAPRRPKRPTESTTRSTVQRNGSPSTRREFWGRCEVEKRDSRFSADFGFPPPPLPAAATSPTTSRLHATLATDCL